MLGQRPCRIVLRLHQRRADRPPGLADPGPAPAAPSSSTSPGTTAPGCTAPSATAAPPNSKTHNEDQEGSLTESSALSVKAGQPQPGGGPPESSEARSSLLARPWHSATPTEQASVTADQEPGRSELPHGTRGSELAGSFGSRDLVMAYRQIAFGQEPLILGIENGLLDILPSKGLNRFPGIPETHGDELGPVTIGSPQRPSAAVARRLLALDARLLDVAGIRSGVICANRATPDSCDHSSFPSGTAARPRGRRPPGARLLSDPAGSGEVPLPPAHRSIRHPCCMTSQMTLAPISPIGAAQRCAHRTGSGAHSGGYLRTLRGSASITGRDSISGPACHRIGRV